MTALKQYERIEATGLWRPAPEAQRREVLVSIGEATLTISDFNDRALTHWSLAALERQNPGAFPALYSPDGDPGETLELAEGETTMITAIDRLQRAIDSRRARPGRIRWITVALVMTVVLAGLALWLPGALRRHVVAVVPEIKRQEIGRAVLVRVERVTGQACTGEETDAILSRLAQRTGVRRLVVVPGGRADSLFLPGGIVVLNHALIGDHEDSSIAAGYILAERARAQAQDPLDDLLYRAGPVASFRLLTTGSLTPGILDSYAERVLAEPRPDLPDETLLGVFSQAAIPSSPYAYARDITGETVLGLIEADPMTGRTLEPVLADRDWVRLQDICGG
ncbi:hypothetical protein KBY24_11290 [Ruegeria pomeroyi]|uniref:Uncharacterized protein n=1 Tax=Ruegeria alba TaxID=2916756 RepID=A0ABS9NUH9_9RHOB|nr:hypothetical protein [Ruegeria alba]MCE8512852.1 hypothetical protein [Ruegeria pomeroyi]MCE8521550.1 hypothetical protein [Ruegeria pomeroyi]MCE8525977.1 hypothetical protein [Ruegeria pomeroyi]MCE8530398.1 hypothetical protein [Ruegeria pomeroyi]MCE8533968.1 hypothetical protein [Ruegeria pomeroyi]